MRTVLASKLPLLREHRAALETCGYCPRLCRSSCPVSNAEPREALIPGAKMSTVWLAGRGDVPLDRDHAATAWACSGCFACRERCELKNPVVPTLNQARAAYFEAGLAPAAAAGVVARHADRLARAERTLQKLRELPGVDPTADTALLVGCSYLGQAPEVARDIVQIATRVTRAVRLVSGCCGAPLLSAGDRAGFLAEQKKLAASLGNTTALLCADPGCAVVLHQLEPMWLLELVDVPAHRLGRLEHAGPTRYHDPCQLSRGLGIYDPPRRILSRILGRAPDEFDQRREHAACSGAGGLLPLTMPHASARIAEARIREHEALGAGRIVTACATSLWRFRSRGADAVDLHSLVREALDA